MRIENSHPKFVSPSVAPTFRWYSTKPMHDDPRGQGNDETDKSFADILNEFENTTRAAREKTPRAAKGKGKSKPAAPPRHGTVVGVSGDFVLIDYGGKSEGLIPTADLLDPDGKLSVKRGDSFDVSITGFN